MPVLINAIWEVLRHLRPYRESSPIRADDPCHLRPLPRHRTPVRQPATVAGARLRATQVPLGLVKTRGCRQAPARGKRVALPRDDSGIPSRARDRP